MGSPAGFYVTRLGVGVRVLCGAEEMVSSACLNTNICRAAISSRLIGFFSAKEAQVLHEGAGYLGR